MKVAHRRAHVAVSQEALDGVDIGAGFEQVNRQLLSTGIAQLITATRA